MFVCVSPAGREVTRPIRQVEHCCRALLSIMHARACMNDDDAWQWKIMGNSSMISIFNIRHHALFTRSVRMTYIEFAVCVPSVQCLFQSEMPLTKQTTTGCDFFKLRTF